MNRSHISLFNIFVLLIVFILFCNARALAQAPDLVVTDVAVNDECRTVVTLLNQGDGSMLPASEYGTTGIAVQFIKDDAGFGGWALLGPDIEAIRMPGGTLTKTFPPLIEDDVSIKVVVDSTEKVSESNETNNTLSRPLSCVLPLPDLAVTAIRFADDCRVTVSLANLGDAPLPDGIYGLLGSSLGKWSWLERTFDGVAVDEEISSTLDGAGSPTLKSVDPTRELQPPGGTHEWTDNGSERAGENVRYHWKLSTNLNTALREKHLNVENNVREATPPARCLSDLVVSDLQLDDQCHIIATVRNAGTGQLPTAALRTDPPFTGTKVAIQFAINGKGAGGWSLSVAEASGLEKPGDSITVKSTSRVQGSAVVNATIDVSRKVPEANETNNAMTKKMACPGLKPPLILTPTRPLQRSPTVQP